MAIRNFLTNLYGLSLAAEPGGLVNTYLRNTSTPVAVYTDIAGTVPATNPVVADSLGQITFYYSDAVQYTWRATTANGATVLWEASVVGGSVSYTFIQDGLIKQFSVDATGTGASQIVTIPNVILTSPHQVVVKSDGLVFSTDEYEVSNNGTDSYVTLTAASGAFINLRSNAVQGLTGPAGTPADMDSYTTLSGGDGTESHWVRTSGSLNRKVTTNNMPVTPTGRTVGRTLSDRFAERINAFDFIPANLHTAIQTGSNTTALHTYLKAAWDAGVATGKNFDVLLPNGDYRVEDEIDCIGITSGSQRGGGFTAETRWRARILATAFGRTKKLFKFGDNTATGTRPSAFAVMRGLIINSHNSIADVDHPIAIWAPYASSFYFENVRVNRWGNTAYWVSDVNNGRFVECQAFRVGTGYVQYDSIKDDLVETLTSTATDATLTCSGTPFEAGMAGKRLYVGNSGYSSGSSAAPLVATISSYTDTDEVELDVAAISSEAGATGSFENIRGGINSGDRTLTVDTAIFSEADVGRYIYIDRAGTDGGVLNTTIASYTSPTVVEVADDAITTVSAEYVWFTHGFWCGTMESDRAASNSPITNDVKFINCLVERYYGVGLSVGPGVNIWGESFKIHGIGDDEAGFGASIYNIMADNTKSAHIQGVEIDFGFGGGSAGGNVAMRGGFCHLSLTRVSGGQIPTYQHFIDFDGNNDSRLVLGDIMIDRALTDLEFVKYSGTATRVNVSQTGSISTRDRLNNWPLQQPVYGSGFAQERGRPMADDTAISFTPPYANGLLFIQTSSSTRFGMYRFRTAIPSLDDMATDGSGMTLTTVLGALNGTTGSDGNFTISAHTDGKIYIENRIGASIFVSWAIIG